VILESGERGEAFMGSSLSREASPVAPADHEHGRWDKHARLASRVEHVFFSKTFLVQV